MAKRKHILYWERNEEQNHKTSLFRNPCCKVSGITSGVLTPASPKL